MPLCWICNASLASTNSLYYHLRFDHKFNSNSAVVCGEESCKRSFSCWSFLRRHLIFFHRFAPYAIRSNPTPLSDLEREDVSSGDASDDKNDDDDGGNAVNLVDEAAPADAGQPVGPETPDIILKQSTALIAKLYANPKLPRSHVQDIVDDVSEFLKNVVNAIKPKLSNEVSADLDALASAFDPFSTDYKRLKFFEKSGFFIKAEEVIIGDRRDHVRENQHRLLNTVSSSAQFVPMRKVLKGILELPNVFEKIREYMSYLDQNPDLLQNFINGEWWKEKKKHFGDKILFPLFLYFDDLEINNVLGSHSGVQKLGLIYFSIATLPPEYSSRLENIFLASMFHSLDRVERGSNAKLFPYIVNELNFLAREGIQVDVGGNSFQVYFILGRILGDNLGLNSILGFVESFSANYYCRLCRRPKCFCQKDSEEMEGSLRNPNNYSLDALLPVSDSGISESSIWNNVEHFHVTENWIVDRMHDLWEGVCVYDMGHILSFFIVKEKLFTVNDVNDRLLAFDFYGNGLSNQPPTLGLDRVKNRHISMSASEMRSFVLTFTFLVGHLVPANHKIWQFFLLLRRILDITSAKVLQLSDTTLLKALVKEHNALYVELFEDNLKPKHHFLVHYPRVIQQSGPLQYLESMRYESNHRKVKSAATSTTSRRNITYTLTLKSQLNLCERLLSNKGLELRLETGPLELIPDLTEFENFQNFEVLLRTNFDQSMLTSWVDYQGTTYRVGSCLALAVDDDVQPYFGVISKIIINDKQCICLVCRVWSCSGFDSHLHAYPIAETNVCQCMLIEDLLDPYPVIFAQMPNGMYFAAPKHAL